MPRLLSTFQAITSVDRIELNASNQGLDCVHVCLYNHTKGCMLLDRRPFVVAHLSASTAYTLLVYECDAQGSRTSGRIGAQLEELQVNTTAPSEWSS